MYWNLFGSLRLRVDEATNPSYEKGTSIRDFIIKKLKLATINHRSCPSHASSDHSIIKSQVLSLSLFDSCSSLLRVEASQISVWLYISNGLYVCFIFFSRWTQHQLLTEIPITKMMKEKFKHRLVGERGKKLRQRVEHHLNRAKWSVFSRQDQMFGYITQELKKIEISVYATTAKTHSPVSHPQGHQIWGNILKYARTILLGQLDRKISSPLLMMMGNLRSHWWLKVSLEKPPIRWWW